MTLINSTFHKVAGWKGYITDLHDLRDHLRLNPHEAHPVNYALKVVGCVMTAETEQFIRTVIEAYAAEVKP